MYVTNNDTAAPISVSPPRALENVEEARLRRMVEYGGARSAQTRAMPGRLEDEREIRQQREGRRVDDPALGVLARTLLPRISWGRASARGGDAQGRAGELAR